MSYTLAELTTIDAPAAGDWLFIYDVGGTPEEEKGLSRKVAVSSLPFDPAGSAAAAQAASQPLDAGLTALAALSGTDTIYYRSGADTWTAVTIGSGLDFSGGTLSATGGGGEGAPTGASYVTLGTDTDLTAERVLTAGTGITIADGGAGSTVTVALDPESEPEFAGLTVNGTFSVDTLAADALTFGTTTGVLYADNGAVAAGVEGSHYLSGASNKLPLRAGMGGTNATATGTDLGHRHYVDFGATIARVTLTTDANVSGTFTVVVKRSADGGSTFPDTVASISLGSGARAATSADSAQIPIPALNAGDWLRFDITAITGTVNSWSVRLTLLSRNQ